MDKSNLNIKDLVRDNILNLVPYSSARSEYSEHADIYLDANESPFDTGYNRYPDPLQKELKKEIGKLKNIGTDKVFIGNGSDEAIDLIIRVFCTPLLEEVLLVEPTYGMYSVSAAINNIGIVRTNLNEDYTLDADRVLNSVTSTTKVIFLCSPNNPSGNLFEPEQIIRILEGFHGIVVIDEAYIDFSQRDSWLQKIDDYQKMIVLQTFSKAWGLAGLRVGMAFSNPSIIQLLNKVKPPYNISSLVQEKVLKSIINDQSKVNDRVNVILRERKKMREELLKLDFVKEIYPSQSNFLLVQVDDPNKTYQYLVDSGIIVRNRSRLILCEGCLRITIGLQEENRRLMEALKSYGKI